LLTEKGAKPGIVLRGYGGDETLVHERLNPGVPVVVAPDRVRGIREAIALGVDVVILDDAFQHRRASRDFDIVLVDADSWFGSPRLLPAGPWREPLESARRASLVIITRKTAGKEKVEDARRAIVAAAPGIPIAVAHLAPQHIYWSDAAAARGPRSRPDRHCGHRTARVVFQAAHPAWRRRAAVQLRRSSRIYAQ
jgi:tetraacyldisaccharide 4'-kinase